MKKLIIAISIMACGGATVLAQPPCTPIEVISTEINLDRTLFSNVLYRIQGCVAVTSGATLTIQPGTVVTFDDGDYLIIAKTAS